MTASAGKLVDWQKAFRFMSNMYKNVPDAEYAQHMKKLDPLMRAYFITPSLTHVEGFFDTETEEWVETTVILLEPPKQIVELDVCKCCAKPLVVQQDMIWMCWYCSPKNDSIWTHEKCHPKSR